ncbi:hypothetical protein H8356DRAFT_1329813 [Neocallimastix lanati (nom. inval.)]|nr:hypothetical protein H8356DRAFT_1329813 [Neocallimastix sp. JGI-2020a]
MIYIINKNQKGYFLPTLGFPYNEVGSSLAKICFVLSHNSAHVTINHAYELRNKDQYRTGMATIVAVHNIMFVVTNKYIEYYMVLALSSNL